MVKRTFKPHRGNKSTMITGTKKNTVLSAGELFIEIPDTGQGTGHCKIKIGDGSTKYPELPYAMGDTSNEEIELTDDSSSSVNDALDKITNGTKLKTMIAAMKKAINLVNDNKVENSTYNSKMTSLDSTISTMNNKLPFKFGIDAAGNYGYYKAGADTVTPFKNPTGTITITKNGTTDVSKYASANVNLGLVFENLDIKAKSKANTQRPQNEQYPWFYLPKKYDYLIIMNREGHSYDRIKSGSTFPTHAIFKSYDRMKEAIETYYRKLQDYYTIESLKQYIYLPYVTYYASDSNYGYQGKKALISIYRNIPQNALFCGEKAEAWVERTIQYANGRKGYERIWMLFGGWYAFGFNMS